MPGRDETPPRFVGRRKELALFRAALARGEPHVLFVHGPGGVGKTALLAELARMSRRSGATPTYVDARYLEALPAAVLRVARRAARAGRRPVLLLDGYEEIAPLDEWVQSTLLPSLPERLLVIIAGQAAPTPGWRGLPEWRRSVVAVPLENLDPAEATRYLVRSGVPRREHDAILRFTKGHPLALALAADVSMHGPFRPEQTPDLLRGLLDRIVERAPSPRHRAALEACSVVRALTKPLLESMLGGDSVDDAFEWLAGLSCMDRGPHGLVLHDLPRDIVASDLQWRDRERHADLIERASDWYTTRLERYSESAATSVARDVVFLHRNGLAMPVAAKTDASVWFDQARPKDVPELVAMVERHEGRASARIAAHWLARQLEGVRVVRSSAHEVDGFVFVLSLEAARASDVDADPAAKLALRHVRDALRARQRASMFRFWMSRESYQDESPVKALVATLTLMHHFTPRLAFDFFPVADVASWTPVMAYLEVSRFSSLDYTIGGRRYAVFGRDWRVEAPARWLARLARRAAGLEPKERAADAEEARIARATSLWKLTRRQAEVLRRLVNGDSNKDVARALGCAENTVELHVTHLLRRIGATSRTQLVARFWSEMAGDSRAS